MNTRMDDDGVEVPLISEGKVLTDDEREQFIEDAERGYKLTFNSEPVKIDVPFFRHRVLFANGTVQDFLLREGCMTSNKFFNQWYNEEFPPATRVKSSRTDLNPVVGHLILGEEKSE
jgi:hypothetical protein